MIIKRNDGLEYERKPKDKKYTKIMTLKFDPEQIEISQKICKEMGFKSFNDYVRNAIENQVKRDTKTLKDAKRYANNNIIG